MKKLFPLVAAVLIAGYLGLTHLAGNTFSQQITKLEAAVQQEEGLKLVESTKEESFFSSKGQLVVEIDLKEVEPGLKLTISAPWQASHFAGWVNFASQLQLSASDGYDRVDFNQLLGLPSFDLTGTAGLRKITYQQQISQLTSQLDELNIQLENWLIQGKIYYSGKEEQGNFSLAKLKFTQGVNELINLENLTAEFNQQGEFPWLQGQWLMKLGKLNYVDFADTAEINNSQIKLSYQLNQQELNLNYQLSFDELLANQVRLTDAKVATQLSKVNGQAVGSLLQALKNESNNLAKGKAANLSEAEIASLGGKLLADSPRLDINQLSFNLSQPLSFNPSAKGWLEFNGENLPDDFIYQLEAATLDDDELLARLNMEIKITNLPTELLALLGLPAPAIDGETLVIKLEQGNLSLNDQRLF